MQFSNYITSGKRYQIYIYLITEDVKMIGIFLKSVGIRSIKKIERINPASDSDEVVFDLVFPTNEPL
jgi:hypothetical protein